jgi:hypothetical protein
MGRNRRKYNTPNIRRMGNIMPAALPPGEAVWRNKLGTTF